MPTEGLSCYSYVPSFLSSDNMLNLLFMNVVVVGFWKFGMDARADYGREVKRNGR